MNDHDDARFDEALEALARPHPPADHVARVLARTGLQSVDSSVGTQERPAPIYLRPRWVLPVAATLCVVLGATWQIERQARGTLETAIALGGSSPQSGVAPWGTGTDIVQPVLPPQAYWGMDPFREFATLRPGTRVTADGLLAGGSPHEGIPSARGVDDPATTRALTTRRDDELASEPVPSALPPIEVASIAPAPLAAPDAEPLRDITPAEIPLEPIVIAPFDDQERP